MFGQGVIQRNKSKPQKHIQPEAAVIPAADAEPELFKPIESRLKSVEPFVAVAYKLFYVLGIVHEQLLTLEPLFNSSEEGYASLKSKYDAVHSNFKVAQQLTKQRNDIVDDSKRNGQAHDHNTKVLFAMFYEAQKDIAKSKRSDLATNVKTISNLFFSSMLDDVLSSEKLDKLDIVIDKQHDMMESARLKLLELNGRLKTVRDATPPSAPPPEAPVGVLINPSAPSSEYQNYSDEKEISPGGPSLNLGGAKPASQTRKSSVDSDGSPSKSSELIERDSPSSSRKAQRVLLVEQKTVGEFTRGRDGEKLDTAFRLVKDERSNEFSKHMMITHDLAWINVLDSNVKLQHGIWECGEFQLLVSQLGVRPLDETLTDRFHLDTFHNHYAKCIALALLANSNPNKTVVVNFDHALDHGFHLLDIYARALNKAGVKVEIQKCRFLSESMLNVSNDVGAEIRAPKIHDKYAKLSSLAVPKYQANNSAKPAPSLREGQAKQIDLGFIDKNAKEKKALGKKQQPVPCYDSKCAIM